LRGDPAVQGAELGASVYGVELGASVYGAELPAKSAPCQRRAQDLGANNDGAEQCKLGASDDGAEIRVQILKSFLQGRICEKLSKKRLKNKKFGEEDVRGWCDLRLKPTSNN